MNEISNFEEEFDWTETVPHVYVQEKWIPTDQVEFLDISEDFQGFDLMTFLYNGKEYQSRITSRPI